MFGLRGEAQVRHDGDAGVGEQFDGGCHLHAAFEFDRVGEPFFHEPHSGMEALFGAGPVGPEGQIRDNQCVGCGFDDGACQRDHLVERDGQSGGVPVHVVARGIADEQSGNPGFVENAGRELVVGREHGPLLTGVLHALQVHNPGASTRLLRTVG